MRTFMAIASLTAIAAFFPTGPVKAAPPEQPTAQEPSGSAATYRVTVDPDLAGTGIAISTEGWVITTADLVGRCPPAPKRCDIRVDDAARQLWRTAEIVATDRNAGLALLHTNAALPAAATLATRPARPGEPIHAYAFDGNDRLFLPGNVLDNRIATFFGDPPGSGTVVVSTLECRAGTYGTAIFATADGRMLGVVIGTVTGGAGGTVAVPAAAVRRFYEQNRLLYERRTRAAHARR